MRTVLCSTTARGARRPLTVLATLALVVGAVGVGPALPASAAVATPAGGPHARHAAHPMAPSTAVPGAAQARRAGADGVRLGPAVKYVRLADGSIREVR